MCKNLGDVKSDQLLVHMILKPTLYSSTASRTGFISSIHSNALVHKLDKDE